MLDLEYSSQVNMVDTVITRLILFYKLVLLAISEVHMFRLLSKMTESEMHVVETPIVMKK